jgi:hypothetical protein
MDETGQDNAAKDRHGLMRRNEINFGLSPDLGFSILNEPDYCTDLYNIDNLTDGCYRTLMPSGKRSLMLVSECCVYRVCTAYSQCQ